MDLEILGGVGAGVSKLLGVDGDGAPGQSVTSETMMFVRNMSSMLCSSRIM